jgi:lipoyl-dependent peroxiredoxin
MAEPSPGKPAGTRTIDRRAHVFWVADERGGSGRLRADTHAFSSLPMSLAGDLPPGHEATTPGELLAAAQSASFVVTLAELLARDGTPARELAVDATCEIRENAAGARAIAVLNVHVSARAQGLDGPKFKERAEAALATCPISNALSASVPISLDAQLLGAD